MKVFIILFLAVLAGAVGYLMGTEGGRKQRDQLIARVRKDSGSAADAVKDAAAQAGDAVADAVAPIAD